MRLVSRKALKEINELCDVPDPVLGDKKSNNNNNKLFTDYA